MDLDTGYPLKTLDLNGPVRYVDVAGPSADAPTLVLVHGLGSSHLSWLPLIPHLRDRYRVLAMDLPGFGFSEPGIRTARVRDNADVTVRFIRSLADAPVTIAGNSMGGTVSTLVLARNPELLEGMILVDPALPATVNRDTIREADPKLTLFFALYNIPRVGERFMRWRREKWTPRQAVQILMEGVCADPDAVDPDLFDLFVRSAEARRDLPWSDAAFLQAERSMMRTLTKHKASYLATLQTASVPVLLVHGDQDKLVNVESARRLASTSPGMTYHELAGIGHVPQIECPERLAEIIASWRGSVAARSEVGRLPAAQAREVHPPGQAAAEPSPPSNVPTA
ncbi:alpha/beta hydrolase [Euzebya tangerina]|uniref:alpha/beta fold hydrolase n=1 Tax=Euzebya tangerina TaxID=591198 RepID=UPI002F319B50